MSDESAFPPERFANLLRDAGINSPEALMNFLRGNSQTADAEPAAPLKTEANAPANFPANFPADAHNDKADSIANKGDVKE